MDDYQTPIASTWPSLGKFDEFTIYILLPYMQYATIAS